MSKRKIRPLFDKVVVEIENNMISDGGIILTGETNEKQKRGRVIAVGEGRFENGHRIPPSVKVGDLVLLGQWSTVEVDADGTKYVIAIEDGIIGVLGENNDN